MNPQDRGTIVITDGVATLSWPHNWGPLVGGIIKGDLAQTGKDTKKMTGLMDKLPAGVDTNSLKAAAAGISAAVSPAMTTAQGLASGVQGAAAGLQGQVTAISGFSSDITRITSGLPYPANIIGNKIEAINRTVSAKATKGITLTSLTQGGAIEAGTRAQMITRMLPGNK